MGRAFRVPDSGEDQPEARNPKPERSPKPVHPPSRLRDYGGPEVRKRILKILILKPSSLGDVVQALPVLRLIKRHLPASEIYWWIDSNLAPLLEGDPDLAGVVRFQRRRWATPRVPGWPDTLRSKP